MQYREGLRYAVSAVAISLGLVGSGCRSAQPSPQYDTSERKVLTFEEFRNEYKRTDGTATVPGIVAKKEREEKRAKEWSERFNRVSGYVERLDGAEFLAGVVGGRKVYMRQPALLRALEGAITDAIAFYGLERLYTGNFVSKTGEHLVIPADPGKPPKTEGGEVGGDLPPGFTPPAPSGSGSGSGSPGNPPTTTGGGT